MELNVKICEDLCEKSFCQLEELNVAMGTDEPHGQKNTRFEEHWDEATGERLESEEVKVGRKGPSHH